MRRILTTRRPRVVAEGFADRFADPYLVPMTWTDGLSSIARTFQLSHISAVLIESDRPKVEADRARERISTINWLTYPQNLPATNHSQRTLITTTKPGRLNK